MSEYIDKHVDCHVHTQYSNASLGFKDSVNKEEKIMEYVASMGKRAVSFTDHECLSGSVRFLEACEELKEKGKIPEDFKVILGNEIYLLDEEEMKSQMENKERVPFYHFILLAKDTIGHRQLRELSTRAWMRTFTWRGIERRPTYYQDLEEVIGANSGHVIASTACLGGQLAQNVLKEEYHKAEEFIKWGQEVFGEENFFLEMQPHKRKYDEEGNETITEQEIVNTWIRDSGFKSIITTDAHYLNEPQRKLHKAFLTSDNDEDKSSVREVDSFYETTYFMSSEEIHDHLDYYLGEDYVNECIDNTWWIKEQIGEYNLKKKQVVTEIPLPPEEEWFVNDEMLDFFYNNANHFQSILDMWESENIYNAYLISLCMKGATDEFLVNHYAWFKVFQRVNLECEEIMGISQAGGYNMSAYFITMNKFIDIIWNDANAILGVSRGSALGFMINYLLEIVQVSPLEQPVELPHWRSK